MNIAIIGAGNLGTAYALHLAKLKHKLQLYTIEPKVKANIEKTHTNDKYLPGFKLPTSIRVNLNYANLAEAEIIFLCTPSIIVLKLIEQIAPLINKNAIIANASKGFDALTGKPYSILLKQKHPKLFNQYIVLAGPGFAIEIAQHKLTMLIAAGKHNNCKKVKRALETDNLHIALTNDLIGIECSEAYKNIAAIAIGAAEGAEFGNNFKGLLMTQAVAETQLLIKEFGGKPITALSIAGIGDLTTTGFSNESRNYKLGFLMAKGNSLKQAADKIGQVTEGHAMCNLYPHFAKHNPMPLFKAVYSIVCNEAKPQKELKALFNALQKERES